MRPWKIITNLLLILLLSFSASGLVSAKVASGPQTLAADPLQVQSLFNALPCLEKTAYSTTVAPGCSVVAKGLPEGAQYAQKTFNPMFSKGGKFAGQSVDDVAGALRSGAMKPSEVSIDYIMRDGRPLILNTRSSQALEAAGIPRSQWNAVNRTGESFYEGQLNGQISRNPGGPFDTVRRSGGN